MKLETIRSSLFYKVVAVAVCGSFAFRAGSDYRATGEIGPGLMALGWLLWVVSTILPGSGLGKYFDDANASVRCKARALGALNIACLLGGLLCLVGGYFFSFRDAA
jgi:hypothetical protein